MRKKIETTESLEILIPRYAQNKEKMESYKKLVDKDNKQIKESMKSAGETDKEVGGYVAKYIVQQRESMNEDVLISLFTSVPSFDNVQQELNIIKQKPYVDYDALESAIYNGKFTPEMLMDLDKAREVKEVVTLRVSKIKKENKDGIN